MRGFLWGVCRVNAGPDGASPPSFDAHCEPRCSAGVAVDAAGAGASRRDGTIRRDIAASQCCSASERRTDAAGRIAARRRAAADGQRAGTAIGAPGAGRAARAPGGAPPRAAAGAGGSAADGGSQHAARRGDRHRAGARLCGQAQRDGDQDRHADPGDAAVDLRGDAGSDRRPGGADAAASLALRAGRDHRALWRQLALERHQGARVSGAALSRRAAPAGRQHHHLRVAPDRSLGPGADRGAEGAVVRALRREHRRAG